MARIIGIYVIIGLLGAVFLYQLAKAKGASPWPWALFGALTGPFVLFLIRWLNKQEAANQEHNKQDRFKQ